MDISKYFVLLLIIKLEIRCNTTAKNIFEIEKMIEQHIVCIQKLSYGGDKALITISRKTKIYLKKDKSKK
jgi:hypothetical protein